MSSAGDLYSIPITLPPPVFNMNPPDVNFSYDDPSSSGTFDPAPWLKLLQGGVNAYGQIEAIQHGSYSSYVPSNYPAPAPALESQLPAPLPPASTPAAGSGASASFDWSKLKDFSTPWPYAVGLGGLAVFLLLWNMATPSSRR